MIDTGKSIVRKIKISQKVNTMETTIELLQMKNETTRIIQGDTIRMTIERVTEDREVGRDHKIGMIIHLEKPLDNRQNQTKIKLKLNRIMKKKKDWQS